MNQAFTARWTLRGIHSTSEPVGDGYIHKAHLGFRAEGSNLGFGLRV